MYGFRADPACCAASGSHHNEEYHVRSGIERRGPAWRRVRLEVPPLQHGQSVGRAHVHCLLSRSLVVASAAPFTSTSGRSQFDRRSPVAGSRGIRHFEEISWWEISRAAEGGPPVAMPEWPVARHRLGSALECHITSQGGKFCR